MDNELYHYGIKRRSGRYPYGSGERPFQGEPSKKTYKLAESGKKRTDELINDHTIPKNRILYRTTVDPSEKIKDGLYVTYLNVDRDLYKGGYIRQRNQKDTYENSYKLNRDLKVAGRNTIQEAVKDLIKDEKLLKESVKSYFNIIAPKGSDLRYYMDHPNEEKYDPKAFDDIIKKSTEARKTIPVKEQFGTLMASLGTTNKFKSALMEELKKKGYDAMTDEAGIKGFGSTIEGIDPLLIFNSNELTKIKSNKISESEEKKSRKEYLDWQRKAIKNPKRQW